MSRPSDKVKQDPEVRGFIKGLTRSTSSDLDRSSRPDSQESDSSLDSQGVAAREFLSDFTGESIPIKKKSKGKKGAVSSSQELAAVSEEQEVIDAQETPQSSPSKASSSSKSAFQSSNSSKSK